MSNDKKKNIKSSKNKIKKVNFNNRIPSNKINNISQKQNSKIKKGVMQYDY